MKKNETKALWIALATIGTIGAWFTVWLLVWKMFNVAMQSMAVQWQTGVSMTNYEVLSIISPAVSLIVPALLVAPVAQGVFHKAGVKKPWSLSVGLLSAIVFAFAFFQLLFSMFERLNDLPQSGILLLLVGVIVATAILYWLLLVKLSRRISKKWLFIVLAGLPVVALLAEVIYRFSLTPLL